MNRIGNDLASNSTQVSLLCITLADTDSSESDIPEVCSPYDFNLRDANLDQFKGLKAFLKEHQEEKIAEEIAQASEGIAARSANVNRH